MSVNMKRNVGLTMIVVLSVIPILFWLPMKSLDSRFVNLNMSFGSVGQILGLVGMVMFALTLVLSARFRWLEDYFGGLPRMYVIHHYIGSIAFIFLLFHPVVLAGRYFLVSLKSAALFLIPGSDWALNFGIFGLLIMMFLLILTLYVRLPYQVWKFTHKFMGFAFFLAGLHMLLINSDVSNNIFLGIYMWIIFALGFGSYSYHSLLKKYLTKKREYSYIVDEVNHLNNGVVEIVMSPQKEENKMQHIQGQFMFVSFKNLPEQHPFTISSSPYDKKLKITVKVLGDYTSQLRDLKVGTEVSLDGPHGRVFYQDAKSKSQIWVAGGIGITPFLSMIRALKDEVDKDNYRIDLYYAVHDSSEAVFLDEIKQIVSKMRGLRLILWSSKKSGRLSADKIKDLSKGVYGKDVFLCCPPPMSKSLNNQLISLGLSSSRIHFEQFSL